MSSPRITFTYSSRSATDPWWVRLEQEDLPDDTATLDDAASLLDTLYNLDACADSTDTAEENTGSLGIIDAPEVNSEDLEETVDITVDRMACHFDADGNVDVTLRVIRSRQDAPYRLVLSGGALLTTETVTETYSQTILVENASSITLDYPVISGFAAEWSGVVYGDSSEAPVIHLTGNTISFGGANIKSGSVAVSYLTTYDRCTITINGVDGEPGACTARVFFHGLVDELELEIPEASEPLASCTARWTVAPIDYDIECVQIVTVSTRCQCTDNEVSTQTYEEVVDCPESVVRCQGATTECRHVVGSVTVPEYVECADDNEVTGRPGMIYSLSTNAYYEDHCCKVPTVSLPDCPEKKISHRGGLPLAGGAAQYYNVWGPKLRITPISPAGGICGDWTIRQEERTNDCCAAALLEWSEGFDQVEVLARGQTGYVSFTGNAGPFRISLEGTGFYLSNGYRTQTLASVFGQFNVQVRADNSYSCGTCEVTIRDNCGNSLSWNIRSTEGAWFVVDQGYIDLPCTLSASCSGDQVEGLNRWEVVSGKWRLVQDLTFAFENAQAYSSLASAHSACMAKYDEQQAILADDCASDGTASRCNKCMVGSGYTPCVHYPDPEDVTYDPQAWDACDQNTQAFIFWGPPWYYARAYNVVVNYSWIYEWRCA